MKYDREELLDRFQEELDAGRPIIGGGAGTGISAKFAERGGIDLIIIYNSGRYRMGGRGSLAGLLPDGDANEIVMEMAHEVIPVVEDTPVLAGVNGTDPFRDMDIFLDKVKAEGFSGVQNFPTLGLIDGTFRQNLEETEMSFDKEVEMIRIAHEKGLFTTPYAFNENHARALTEAGADIIVAHMGLTASGDIGAETHVGLEEGAKKVQNILEAAKSVNEDVLVLCHGGPFAMPEDAKYALEHTDVVGFYGASSIERLPTEPAIQKQTEKFKALSY